MKTYYRVSGTTKLYDSIQQARQVAAYSAEQANCRMAIFELTEKPLEIIAPETSEDYDPALDTANLEIVAQLKSK